MSTNEYPVFFDSVFVGASAATVYTVPPDQILQDMVLKVTNTDSTARTITVYAVPYIELASGSHDGADNASALSDSTQSWTTDEWAGYKVVNVTDGSEAAITANTSTTVTATLAGGTDNDWDGSDEYLIVDSTRDENLVAPAMSVPANDYILVTFPRLGGQGYISALASVADKVSIQPIGGKLHTP